MKIFTILLTVLTIVIATGAATAGLDKHLKSEFLKDGEWVPGHEIYYVEAPDAKVVFK